LQGLQQQHVLDVVLVSPLGPATSIDTTRAAIMILIIIVYFAVNSTNDYVLPAC
jgi:hypothetical protein